MPGRHLVPAILLCAAFSGCASQRFAASELPRQYQARRAIDLQGLDLGQFATPDEDAEIISPGDRLNVVLDDGTQSEQSVHSWKVSVDGAGQTVLPNIGPVRLAGMSGHEAEKAVVQASLQRQVFLTPVVKVAVEERPERRITVVGAVNEPGVVIIHRDEVSLADALLRAGGLAPEASGVISVSGPQASNAFVDPNAIQTVSSGTQPDVTGLPPTSVGAGAVIRLDQTPTERLAEIMVPTGGVVHVDVAPPEFIRVMGVIRGQTLEIPRGQSLRLLDALTMAGGQTYSNWISDSITITRQIPNSQQTIQIKASVRKARRNATENIVLAPNDVVNVDENVLTFTLSTVSGFLGAGFNASRIGVGI